MISCAFALMLGFLGIGVAAFGQTPSINATNGVLNSADYSASFAPGGLFSIFGTNLASATQQATSFPLPITMGGASVVIVGTGDQVGRETPEENLWAMIEEARACGPS